MKIDEDALRHLETLARLRVPQDDRSAVMEDLTRVLDTFAQLGEVDVEGVEPMVRPVHLENVLRDDAVTPSLPPGRALAAGRAERDGFFEVPRTLDDAD